MKQPVYTIILVGPILAGCTNNNKQEKKTEDMKTETNGDVPIIIAWRL